MTGHADTPITAKRPISTIDDAYAILSPDHPDGDLAQPAILIPLPPISKVQYPQYPKTATFSAAC